MCRSDGDCLCIHGLGMCLSCMFLKKSLELERLCAIEKKKKNAITFHEGKKIFPKICMVFLNIIKEASHIVNRSCSSDF